MKIAGVILAGGRGSRIGKANKALLTLGGKTLVCHVLDRLAPQMPLIGINANRDLKAFALPIVADGIGGSIGPLDGILGAINFAVQHGCTHALTVSVDTPFIPMALVEKLSEKSADQIVIASSNSRVHYTCGLWPVNYCAGLKSFVFSSKSLKLMDYLQQVGFVEADFAGNSPDPFFNINTPEDLAAAARWL